MPRVLCAAAFVFAFALCADAWFGQPTALDLDGKAVDPLQTASHRIVVLVFVRTDCAISSRYAPTIQRLSAAYGDRAEFWLVYPDKGESSAAIRKYLQDYGYKLSALRDVEHALVKRSEAQTTPEAAVFDRNGRLSYHGRIDDWFYSLGRARNTPSTHELEDAILAALQGHAPPVSTATAIGCYISDLE